MGGTILFGASDDKAAFAKPNGCTHTIGYMHENFIGRVKALTEAVPAVYDAVGNGTFPASLDSLSRSRPVRMASERIRPGGIR